MSIFRKKEKAPVIQGGTVPAKKRRWLLPLLAGIGGLLLVAAAVCVLLLPRAEAPLPNYDLKATVCAAGDISLSSEQLAFCEKGTGRSLYDLFSGVAQSVSSADIALGNLEGNLSYDTPDPETYLYPAALAEALEKTGFDILQTANSRTIQNGISSVAETKAVIEGAGMAALGTYASEKEKQTQGVLVREVNGIRFAFLAFTKGLNNMRLPDGYEYCVDLLYTDYDSSYQRIDTDAILKKLDDAKKEKPDFIIALLHWGSENELGVSTMQEKIAELLIENGVDVILGSHSHYVGKMERRTVSSRGGSSRDVFIAYDLGDLLTVSELSRAQYSCLVSLTFEKDSETGAKRIGPVSYIPTYCKSPSDALGVTDYGVLDVLDALHLHDNYFYNSISDALSERLTDLLAALQEQTQSELQVQK